MKKSKLIIDYDFDFELIGLTSTVRGYRLAWELNQVLHIQLVRQADLPVGFKNSEERLFSFYAFETNINRLKLFKNKPQDVDTGKYFLIPEFPHFDFIILAAMNDLYSPQQLLDLIKSAPSVQFAATIPLDGLKSKSNFIF